MKVKKIKKGQVLLNIQENDLILLETVPDKIFKAIKAIEDDAVENIRKMIEEE